MQSVGQKKTKTLRKRCNATITRVLNTSGANYKINLNKLIYISQLMAPLGWMVRGFGLAFESPGFRSQLREATV